MFFPWDILHPARHVSCTSGIDYNVVAVNFYL